MFDEFKYNDKLVGNVNYNGNNVIKIIKDGEIVWQKYYELEYIQSTGTQYIDTGVQTQNGLKYDITFNRQNYVGMLAGSYTEAAERHYIGNHNSSNQLRYGYFDWYDSSSVPSLNTKYNLIVDFTSSSNQYMYLNGTQIASSSNTRTYSGRRHTYLFAYNENGLSEPGASCKIYSAKIYLNNILVRDFVPVVRASDGEVGLWDKVNHQFYTNSGTGRFETPFSTKVYQPLEYIESNGTQYIDTGYEDGLKVTVDCHMYTSSSVGNYWFGSQQNSSSMMYNGLYSTNSLEYNWLNVVRTPSNDLVMTQRISGSNTFINMNGDTTTVATGTVAPIGNMFIFGCRYSGGGVRPYSGGNLKCYYFKMYDNNILVRSFIPALRRIDNVAGLYDLVTGKFYTNAGSGSFSYTIPSVEYTKYNYLQSSGTQYIDTGIEIKNGLNTKLDYQFVSYDSNERYVFGLDSPTVFGMINGSGRIYEFGAQRYTFALDTNRHIATVGQKIIFDGTTIASSIIGTSTGKNGYLFASNTLGGTVNYFSSSKLYSCKMYQDNELVRDFIPIKLPNGTSGLLNKISRTFYGNIGSGDFSIS